MRGCASSARRYVLGDIQNAISAINAGTNPAKKCIKSTTSALSAVRRLNLSAQSNNTFS